jgi:nucleolar protein 58
MLFLFETSAGFAIFKIKGNKRFFEIKELDCVNMIDENVKLESFCKFENVLDAFSAIDEVLNCKVPQVLLEFLSKNIYKYEELGVSDAKFGNLIKENCGISCVYGHSVNKFMRIIRSELENLISHAGYGRLHDMSVGLSHLISRSKLQFSPDKDSVMVVQAIKLIDNLDLELNVMSMRVREWYGWHFPEMTKIITDNIEYAQIVLNLGFRENITKVDLSATISDGLMKALKEAAFVSMGTEISSDDLKNLSQLCEQVICFSHYRKELNNYLHHRMNIIAPNLTMLVGEIVGARLIAHAGSLINLAKYPSSTVQIIGAEKALFRSIKAKKDTPKYGIIYHAPIISRSSMKSKGKISRILAAKCALSIRVDALGESSDANMGIKGMAKVEFRLRQLDNLYQNKFKDPYHLV